MTIRETLTRIRDDAQAGLDALDLGTSVPKLGPLGEWTPDWLTTLNNAYRAKFPDGYTGDVVDPRVRSRVPLVLAGKIIWGNMPGLTAEQREASHWWVNIHAYGVQANPFTLIRDHRTGIARIAPVYVEGATPGPGEYTLVLASALWLTEAEVEGAVVDLYERTFGPL